MKSYKQVKALLGMLAVISILPGCGKSSDNGSTVVSGSNSTSSSIGLSGNNCYYLNNGSVSYGSGVTLTFQGNGYMNYDGSLNGEITGSSFGFNGQDYTRSNSAGDSMSVWVSNNSPGQQMTIQVVANLSASTVAYFQAANLPVCGLYFNEAYVAGSTITVSVPYLTMSSSYYGGSLSEIGTSYGPLSL